MLSTKLGWEFETEFLAPQTIRFSPPLVNNSAIRGVSPIPANLDVRPDYFALIPEELFSRSCE